MYLEACSVWNNSVSACWANNIGEKETIPFPNRNPLGGNTANIINFNITGWTPFKRKFLQPRTSVCSVWSMGGLCPSWTVLRRRYPRQWKHGALASWWKSCSMLISSLGRALPAWWLSWAPSALSVPPTPWVLCQSVSESDKNLYSVFEV